MEAGKQLAVPLCLPENWSFDGTKATGDKLKCRGSMKISSEGRRLLEQIGDDEVAVICVTGPARSGKSYLLSKLVDNVSFEVGHGVISKTTGIWIACSQSKIEIEGNHMARILLLDAEGVGAVATEDDSVSMDWDAKLFSLCCLLSSVMIYNSKKIPESTDLERLQFVANFSKAALSADQNGASLKVSTPKLLWILRDVLDDPEPFRDWEDYFRNKVLIKRPERSHSDESFNNVVDGITTFFHSLSVKALPPPSNNPLVCKNLDKPEHLKDIKEFLDGIKDVKDTIFNSIHVEGAGTPLMSGKSLLSLLEIFVKELNKEGDAITIKTCWDATITLHIGNVIQSSYDDLEQSVEKIKLPLKQQELKCKHTEITEEIKEKFLKSILLKDDNTVRSFLEKLGHKFDLSLKRVEERNFATSEEFCKKKAEEIMNENLTSILQMPSTPSIIEKLQLYEDMTKTISEQYKLETEGLPKAQETFEKMKNRIQEKIHKGQEDLILSKIYEICKEHMENVLLPVETDELDKKSKEAKKLAHDSCREFEKFIKPEQKSIYELHKETKIDALIKTFQDKNDDTSRDLCEKAMGRALEDLKKIIDCPSIWQCPCTINKEKYVKMYRKQAAGPLKKTIEEELIKELEDLVPRAKEERSRKAQECLEQVVNVAKECLHGLSNMVQGYGKRVVMLGVGELAVDGGIAVVRGLGGAVVNASFQVISTGAAKIAGLFR